jgi:hypothetical protein
VRQLTPVLKRGLLKKLGHDWAFSKTGTKLCNGTVPFIQLIFAA